MCVKCPIHHGDRLNFKVNPTTGQWFCHSQCAVDGDVFAFEMARFHYTFAQALKAVVEWAGVYGTNSSAGNSSSAKSYAAKSYGTNSRSTLPPVRPFSMFTPSVWVAPEDRTEANGWPALVKPLEPGIGVQPGSGLRSSVRPGIEMPGYPGTESASGTEEAPSEAFPQSRSDFPCGGSPAFQCRVPDAAPSAPDTLAAPVRSPLPSGSPNLGQGSVIPLTCIQNAHAELLEDTRVLDWLLAHRGLTRDTLIRFEVGLSYRCDYDFSFRDWLEWPRILFPLYDAKKRLVNIRQHLFQYDENVSRAKYGKTKPWGQGLLSELFPRSVLEDARALPHPELLLVEGEADALLANQLGFPAVSGTLGAGGWAAGIRRTRGSLKASSA